MTTRTAVQRRQAWQIVSGVLAVAVGASAAELIAEVADIVSDPLDGSTDGSWFRLGVVAVFMVAFGVVLLYSSRQMARAAEIVLAVEISRPGFDNRYSEALRRLDQHYRRIPLPIRLETAHETTPGARATITDSVDNMLGTIADQWPDHGLLVFVNARPHDAYLVGSRLASVTSKGNITLLQPDQDGRTPFDESLVLVGRHVPYAIDNTTWPEVVHVSTPEVTGGTPGILDVILHGTIRATTMPANVAASAREHGHLGSSRVVLRVDYDKLNDRNLAAELPLFVRGRVVEQIRNAPPDKRIHTVQLYTAAANHVVVALGYYQFPVLGVTTHYMAALPTGDSNIPMRYERFALR